MCTTRNIDFTCLDSQGKTSVLQMFVKQKVAILESKERLEIETHYDKCDKYQKRKKAMYAIA